MQYTIWIATRYTVACPFSSFITRDILRRDPHTGLAACLTAIDLRRMWSGRDIDRRGLVIVPLVALRSSAQVSWSTFPSESDAFDALSREQPKLISQKLPEAPLCSGRDSESNSAEWALYSCHIDSLASLAFEKRDLGCTTQSLKIANFLSSSSSRRGRGRGALLRASQQHGPSVDGGRGAAALETNDCQIPTSVRNAWPESLQPQPALHPPKRWRSERTCNEPPHQKGTNQKKKIVILNLKAMAFPYRRGEILIEKT